MRHERFFEPISDADPCGPDLDEIGDEQYINYLIPAEGRVPEQFFVSADSRSLDSEKVQLPKELAAIDDLLERSRDLRLLTLEARFQSFFGSIREFADCLKTIAGLLDRFWDEVHPRATDGDFTLRRNTIEALDDMKQVVIPLQHLPLVRDKRLGAITTRQYLVGSGAVAARADEKGGDPANILRALGTEENRTATEDAHDALTSSLGALARISAIFAERDLDGAVPSFERLTKLLGQALTLVETARPDLKSEGVRDEELTLAPETDSAESAAAPAMVVASAPGVAAAAAISSQAEARAALAAVRTYFLEREPSSPALIIIHQAHHLLGRPLTEIIDALLPNAADKATLKFDPAYNFQLSMPSMRKLAEEAVAAATPPAAIEKTFHAASRAEAASLMGGVEAFLRSAEPSSPVPLLIAKARGGLARDFTMILNDLMPRPS